MSTEKGTEETEFIFLEKQEKKNLKSTQHLESSHLISANPLFPMKYYIVTLLHRREDEFTLRKIILLLHFPLSPNI